MSASQHNDGEELSSNETVATAHRSDADMSSSEQIPVAATATATAALSADYTQIAKLFAQLDQQVGTFTSNMDTIIQQAPAMDGLTALWEEQAKVAATDTTPKPMGAQQQDDTDNDTAMVLGDEAENTNDPLIFL
jgi:hypothetical protein